MWWIPGLGRSPEGGYWRWRDIREVDEEVKDLNTGWVTCVDFAVYTRRGGKEDEPETMSLKCLEGGFMKAVGDVVGGIAWW